MNGHNSLVLRISCVLLCYNFKEGNALLPSVHTSDKLNEVFTWKQIEYIINGLPYFYNTPPGGAADPNEYYIKYNNVPVGIEVYGDRMFVSVPRRRYGIPSTLNFIQLRQTSKSPPLLPYPSTSAALYSVYRPRADRCGRLWVVDTGLLQVPNARKQIKQPEIVVFNVNTDEVIMRYPLRPTDLVNERTPSGLTSITVDVVGNNCDNTFAYITDLATNGLIVFSLRARDSWRVQHESFEHDPAALNFTVAGHPITWRDGLFSVTLTDEHRNGSKTALYHPVISTKEFATNTDALRDKFTEFKNFFRTVGTRGNLSQSGCHAYHEPTRTVLFANIAQDAIQCWNIDKPLTPENVQVVAQDHKKLVYISDLKVSGDDVWVLVNQMPTFVFSSLDQNKNNFFVHSGRVQDLIRGSVCDETNEAK